MRDGIADASAYPFSIPSLARLETLELHPCVTFLTGANAAGKSTP
jgi:predicted ATPase